MYNNFKERDHIMTFDASGNFNQPNYASNNQLILQLSASAAANRADDAPQERDVKGALKDLAMLFGVFLVLPLAVTNAASYYTQWQTHMDDVRAQKIEDDRRACETRASDAYFAAARTTDAPPPVHVSPACVPVTDTKGNTIRFIQIQP